MIVFLLIIICILLVWILVRIDNLNNNICVFAEIVKQLKREIENI